MYFVMFGYFVFCFFLNSRYLGADSSFFDLPTKSDKNWNPSNDFFDEKLKDSTHYDPSLEIIDKFPENVVNINNKIKGSAFVDKIEHNKETLMSTKITSQQPRNKYKKNKEDLQYKAYFTRFINIFLRETGLEEGTVDEDSKTVTIDITLSKQDLGILKKFGSDNDISYEMLENSFISIIRPIEKYSTLKMIFDSIPLQTVVLLPALIVGIVYISRLIQKFQLNKTLIIFATLVVYMSIVSLDLLHQYEDVTEKMILKRMEFGDLRDPPKACFKSKLNIYEKLYYHFIEDDICQNFLDSRKSFLYNIDVASAFIKPFSSIYLRLCSVIGESVEKLIEPTTGKYPFPLNFILSTTMIFFRIPLLIFLFYIIISTLYNGRISLSIPFFSLNSGSNENSNDSRKAPREALEGSGYTGISNHSGGIILIANNNSLMENGMNKENFNFQLNRNLGSTAIGLNYLQNNEAQSVKKGPDHIQDRKMQCSGFTILKERVNSGTNSRQLSFDSQDDSNKSNFPIFHSSWSTTPDDVFNIQQKLLDEKVKVKKNKSFKKRNYKWKNITEENIKDIFKLHVTK